jgi:hypothetical protein
MMSPASGFAARKKDHVGALLFSERGAGIPDETGRLNHGHRNGQHDY